MTKEYSYRSKAAAGYDVAFSLASKHFVPFLLRAAQLGSGEIVLDVATGPGIAAEAALVFVGALGDCSTRVLPDVVR